MKCQGIQVQATVSKIWKFLFRISPSPLPPSYCGYENNQLEIFFRVSNDSYCNAEPEIISLTILQQSENLQMNESKI